MEVFKPLKPVIHILFDGSEKEYGSIGEAAQKTGISRTTISRMCNKQRVYKRWHDGSFFRFKHEWHITQKLKL